MPRIKYHNCFLEQEEFMYEELSDSSLGFEQRECLREQPQVSNRYQSSNIPTLVAHLLDSLILVQVRRQRFDVRWEYTPRQVAQHSLASSYLDQHNRISHRYFSI